MQSNGLRTQYRLRLAQVLRSLAPPDGRERLFPHSRWRGQSHMQFPRYWLHFLSEFFNRARFASILNSPQKNKPLSTNSRWGRLCASHSVFASASGQAKTMWRGHSCPRKKRISILLAKTSQTSAFFSPATISFPPGGPRCRSPFPSLLDGHPPIPPKASPA